MEEKTLFTLAATNTHVSSEGVSQMGIPIWSYKTQYINGNAQTKQVVGFEYSLPSWITFLRLVPTGAASPANDYTMYVKIDKNTGSSRVGTIEITQDESGKTATKIIEQEAGVTYTDVLELPPLMMVTVNSNKGSTDSVEVTAYSLGSDGSKIAKRPNVGNTPSWANQVSIEAGSAEHRYKITFTATETNTSTSVRTSPVIISCGTVTKTISVSQRGQTTPIQPQFTLTGLPLNKSCYLFASGSRPQSGGSSDTGYLMIHGLGGQVTMKIPVTVNLSSYGGRTTADTGDIVTVWTSSGSTFSQIGSFTVPSAGGTVSI